MDNHLAIQRLLIRPQWLLHHAQMQTPVPQHLQQLILLLPVDKDTHQGLTGPFVNRVMPFEDTNVAEAAPQTLLGWFFLVFARIVCF